MTASTPQRRTDVAGPLPDVDEALDRLLDAELGYRPEARSGFISHLAMGLVAARRLGATDDDLEQWFRAHVDDGHLLARERPGWLQPLALEVADRGTADVVRSKAAAMVVAPLAQFFHAMIRLELALDAGHAGQVANAIHNWTASAEPLSDPPTGTGEATLADVLDRLRHSTEATDAADRSPEEVAAAPWFVAATADLGATRSVLDDASAAAAASHTEPGHFGTLHLVTGTRAAQAVSPLLGSDDADLLALRTAHAVTAALVSFGLVGRVAAAIAQNPTDAVRFDGDAVAVAALASGDAHVAKLVYACQLEHARTGDSIYHRMASRQVGLRATD